MEQPQAQPPQSPEVNVEELAAKISSDLLALKEASPEAYEQLVAAIGSEPPSEESGGMMPAMAGKGGVPMSHGR